MRQVAYFAERMEPSGAHLSYDVHKRVKRLMRDVRPVLVRQHAAAAFLSVPSHGHSAKPPLRKKRKLWTSRSGISPEIWALTAARTEEDRRRRERERQVAARQRRRQARANELAAFRSLHMSRIKLVIAIAARTRLDALRTATSSKASDPGIRRLKGQEKDLVRYWTRARTTHANHGGKASLRQLAYDLRMSIGAIQRREKMITGLNQSIWRSIVETEPTLPRYE